MKKLLLTIIVPIYNCEKHITRCLDTICNQTYRNIEIVLVDDGSTDNSYKICLKYQNMDKRIRLYKQKNSGASSARNFGLSVMSGEYFTFVDSDDYLEETMVEEFVDRINETKADYLICGFTIEKNDSRGNLVARTEKPVDDIVIDSRKKIAAGIIKLVENEQINAPWCKCIRSNIIRENQIRMQEDLKLQEDLHFNINVLKFVDKFASLEKSLYYYSIGSKDSLTARYFDNKFEMIDRVHNSLVSFYQENSDDEKINNRVKFIYIKNIFAGFINLFHKNCDLDKNQKMKIIGKYISTNKFNEIIRLKFDLSLKKKILLWILRTKNKKFIYLSSYIFNILKKYFSIQFN